MSIFVTGTGTGVGKTHTAAALLSRYATTRLRYWKPVQTGEDDDCALTRSLSGLSADRFAPTGWKFREPLSPHRAAELEGRFVTAGEILTRWNELENEGPLLVEGAGGVYVPLNRKETWADLLIHKGCAVVIAASSGLGTINHSLLTIHALRDQHIPIAGIFFCGPRNDDNMKTILEFSQTASLGWLDFTGDLAESPGEIDPDGILEGAF